MKAKDENPLTMEQRELCSKHMLLARHVAMKRKSPYVPPEDRLQDAYMGLIDAARKFDPSMGLLFSTYASHRILGAIIDGERRRSGLIHSPRSAKRRPVRTVSFSDLGMDAHDEGRGYLGSDVVAVDPRNDAESIDRRDAVRVAIESLTERSRHIATRYLTGEATLKQIGAELGISEARVSQLTPNVIDQLRNHSAITDYARR